MDLITKNRINILLYWADPHFNLGYIYQKQKKFNETLHEYQTTLKLKPELIQGQKLLEQVTLQLQSK